MQVWPLYVIFVISVLLGAALLLLPVRTTWRWMRGKKKEGSDERAKPPRPLASAGEILVGLLLLSISFSCVSLLGMLASFRAFSEKTLVARVTAEPVRGARQKILVRYTPVAGEKEGLTVEHTVSGDQWRIEGHILRWSGWTRLLGLRTCFRTTRIDGRYVRASDEETKPHAPLDLGGEDDPVWLFLYRHGQRLPGVEAVYGTGARFHPERGTVFSIYMTPGGYVIERKS